MLAHCSSSSLLILQLTTLRDVGHAWSPILARFRSTPVWLYRQINPEQFFHSSSGFKCPGLATEPLGDRDYAPQDTVPTLGFEVASDSG